MKIETSIKSLPILLFAGAMFLVFFYFAGEFIGLYISNIFK